MREWIVRIHHSIIPVLLHGLCSISVLMSVRLYGCSSIFSLEIVILSNFFFNCGVKEEKIIKF